MPTFKYRMVQMAGQAAMLRLTAFIFLLLSAGISSSQNTLCANATPFCTGQTMNFPATTGLQNSQPGPNYGCLGSQPNPTWFFFQIQQGGPMVITMAATQDIDFICWGPFASLNGACSNLTSGNTIDCSYSGSNTETCTIANAQAGAFYLLLITNFAGISQNVTFTQANANVQNAASTNCGMICLVSATNSGIICSGNPATLAVNTASTSTAVSTYTWYGPGNFSSNGAAPVIPSLTSTTTFTLMGTANSTVNGTPFSNTCQAMTTVTVVPYPTYSISQSTPTICQGGNLSASVAFSPPANASQFTYAWGPLPGTGIFNPYTQSTPIYPPLQPPAATLATIVYSVTVTPVALFCPVTRTMAVTINNPSTPTLTMPPPLCNTFPQHQLLAVPGGGTWSANTAVTASGLLSPAFAPSDTNTVKYSVSVGNCIVSKTDTFYVSIFHTAGLTANLGQVCEQDPATDLLAIVQDTVTGQWQGPGVTSNRYFSPTNLATGIYSFTYHTQSTPHFSVCPASTVLNVQVFNPPTPTIAPIGPRCTNAQVSLLTAMPLTGGVWSGNPAVSAGGVLTPSLAQPGSNPVLYTSGQGTCVASQTAFFHVSEFRTAALTGTVPHLCVTSSPINLFSICQNTQGLWSGPNVSNAQFTTPGLPTGTYTLRYVNPSWPDQFLCPDSTKINASLLNPPMPSIGTPGSLCSKGSTVQLTANPSSGKWVTTSYLTSTGLFTPSLAAIGNNHVEFVTGTSTCNTSKSEFISVEAFVPATLSGGLPDLCNNNLPVSLNIVALSQSGNWTGPGVQGHSFDPALSGAGNFTLVHQTSSAPSGLCPDAAYLTVRVYSLESPKLTNPGAMCNSSPPAQIKVTPLGGIFGSGLVTAVTPGGLFFPSRAFIGDNIVTYSIAEGPCIAFGQTTITVAEFVPATFAHLPEKAYCRDHQPFNLYKFSDSPYGLWTGNGVTGSMFDPGKAAPGTNIIVYTTFSKPDPLLCPDSNTLQLVIEDVPEVAASVIPPRGCAPLSVLFKVSAKTGNAAWNTGDGKLPEGLYFNHVYSSPGTYSVTMNYWLGVCALQINMPASVVVLESPAADFVFSRDQLTTADPEVTMVNKSRFPGNNRFSWDIQGVGAFAAVNPTVSFPQAGIYRVTLSATSFEGCVHETTKYIEVVNESAVYIPDAFTPDFDGLNDVFRPVFTASSVNPRSYRLEVFDRWGHQVYSGTDVNEGWDGTMNNSGDELVKQDVYPYLVIYSDLDGKRYRVAGAVSLLRR
jgi:gliding motility-associated-like protein